MATVVECVTFRCCFRVVVGDILCRPPGADKGQQSIDVWRKERAIYDQGGEDEIEPPAVASAGADGGRWRGTTTQDSVECSSSSPESGEFVRGKSWKDRLIGGTQRSMCGGDVYGLQDYSALWLRCVVAKGFPHALRVLGTTGVDPDDPSPSRYGAFTYSRQ
jgi:hypothetical protein